MEVFQNGNHEATAGDVDDAGKDVLAGTATGLATESGSAILGRDRQGTVE
jgi:hypothetical protein